MVSMLFTNSILEGNVRKKHFFFKSLIKQSYTLKQTDYYDKTELLFNIFKNSGLAFIISSQLH